MVHVCCASCASNVMSQLVKAGFSPLAFFYNPQIDSKEEYVTRLEMIKVYCQETKVNLCEGNYEPADFYQQLAPYKDKSSIKYISDADRYQRRRCQICNNTVIQKTIEEAKRLKIKYFTTALLCSPYKEHEQIVSICNEKALDYNLNFYYCDFRKGYWMGRNYARSHHLVSPSYCGCGESLAEKRLE